MAHHKNPPGIEDSGRFFVAIYLPLCSACLLYTSSPSQMHPSSLYREEFDPQENIDQQELKRALAEAIDSLNEQERTVLSLYYYENLTMKEIGQVMEVSEQRIGQINRKLIEKLRDKLSQYIGG